MAVSRHRTAWKPAVTELMLDGLNPILTTEEADRLVGWQLVGGI